MGNVRPKVQLTKKSKKQRHKQPTKHTIKTNTQRKQIYRKKTYKQEYTDVTESEPRDDVSGGGVEAGGGGDDEGERSVGFCGPQQPGQV